ncbi:MAG: phosphoglycerate dehydrogenase [Lachnospiraceae bacterium]|nr:phosphoglycerate dehydrogenase [Lachnospiraceae bacterium]
MYQVHCLNKISKVGLAHLTDQYECNDNFDAADAILVRSAAMHDMEMKENLLAIARAGAGVNNIPLEKCAEKGIVVFNTPGANANAVKELVIAGMLLASRDIIGGVEWVKENKAEETIAKMVEKEKSKFAGCELLGKKLGVIGLGAIGAKIANTAVSLGMEVYGYDPYISVEAAWSLSREVQHIKNVEKIYTDCDYITIHVPALDNTKGMINQDTIALMKDGVVVLNFSRDVLVNDAAMAEALKSGKVKRYVTDFPNPASANMEHVIAIPHLGASTEEAEDNCAVMAVNQVMDYLENGNIKNSVNFPACDMGVCSKAGRIAIHHRNVPNMLAKFTGACSAENINISDMINKSMGEYSYTLMDIDSPATEAFVKVISEIPEVLKVRIVK